MDKIYSRKRIPLNFNCKKINFRKRKNLFKIYKIVTIMVIAIIVGVRLESFANPLYIQVCEEKVKQVATLVTNEQATIVMENYSYDDMFSIEKDEQGNISMVKSNIANINCISSDIAIRTQNELLNEEKSVVKIPMGAFTGVQYLAGVGPDVKINIVVLGNVETEVKSKFESQGINQTIHRVYLEIICNVSILTPYRNINEKIVNQVLLIENIIVGRIPDAYYNLEGISQDNAVEMIN
jgi:sporulation protein YunB